MVSEHSLSVKTVLEIMETNVIHYVYEGDDVYKYESWENKYYKGERGYINYHEISPDESIVINLTKIPQFFKKINSILGLQDFYLNAYGKYYVDNIREHSVFHYEVNVDADGFRLPYLNYLPENDSNISLAKKSKKPVAYHNIPENNIVYFYTFYQESRGYKSLYRCVIDDYYFCDEIKLAIPIKDKK